MYLNAGHRPYGTYRVRIERWILPRIGFQLRHRRLKPTAIYNPHFIRVGIPSDKPAKLFFSFANPVENAGKQFSKNLKSGGGIIHRFFWSSMLLIFMFYNINANFLI